MGTEKKGNDIVERFCKVYGWMLNLGLKQSELIVFAYVYAFCHTNTETSFFYGSLQYLGTCVGVNKSSISKCLKDLVAKGCIEKKFNDNGRQGYVTYSQENLTKKFDPEQKKKEENYKQKIGDDSCVIIYDWMAKMGLKGTELLLFACIYRDSYLGDECDKTLKYLSTWTDISRQSVCNALKKLNEAGFIKKRNEIDDKGNKKCLYSGMTELVLQFRDSKTSASEVAEESDRGYRLEKTIAECQLEETTAGCQLEETGVSARGNAGVSHRKRGCQPEETNNIYSIKNSITPGNNHILQKYIYPVCINDIESNTLDNLKDIESNTLGDLKGLEAQELERLSNTLGAAKSENANPDSLSDKPGQKDSCSCDTSAGGETIEYLGSRESRDRYINLDEDDLFLNGLKYKCICENRLEKLAEVEENERLWKVHLEEEKRAHREDQVQGEEKSDEADLCVEDEQHSENTIDLTIDLETFECLDTGNVYPEERERCEQKRRTESLNDMATRVFIISDGIVSIGEAESLLESYDASIVLGCARELSRIPAEDYFFWGTEQSLSFAEVVAEICWSSDEEQMASYQEAVFTEILSTYERQAPFTERDSKAAAYTKYEGQKEGLENTKCESYEDSVDQIENLAKGIESLSESRICSKRAIELLTEYGKTMVYEATKEMMQQLIVSCLSEQDIECRILDEYVEELCIAWAEVEIAENEESIIGFPEDQMALTG